MVTGAQPPALAAVILAAGGSTRMGEPKALLRLGDRSFVAACVALARAAECAPIVVVEGACPIPEAELAGARRRAHAGWRRGQLSSLQAGLAALAGERPAPGVLVLTVDRPHLRADTVRLLARAHARLPHAIWQPELGGRRGHPIVFPGVMLPALMALPEGNSPRDLLRLPEVAEMRRGLAVADPAIHDNIDSEAELARLHNNSGRRARGRAWGPWTPPRFFPTLPPMEATLDFAGFAGLNPRFDRELGLLVLNLDHGKANEIGGEQLAALEALCATLEAPDSPVSCLCTTSQRLSRRGTPIFIAGANVTERRGWDDVRVKAHVIRQRQLMRRLRHAPIYTLRALAHGITLGWGVEFLLTADYTLATPAASFGLPETGLGILPGARGTAELALSVGPSQALRLGCTGESVSAGEAARIGLVHELVDNHAAGMVRVEALARALRTRSPTAVAAYKRGLLAALGRPEDERLAIEREAYELCVDSGDAAVGREHFAAIRAGAVPPWGRRRT